MTTMTMTPGTRYDGASLVERRPQTSPTCEDTNVRLLRAHAAHAIAEARPSGETHRGKPPIVSTRLVVLMHWTMFAACALRLALGPL
jgi:hypothetical protein